MGTKPGRDQPLQLLRALAEPHRSPSCSTLQQHLAQRLWGVRLSPHARQYMQDAHKANDRELEQGREKRNRNKLAGQAATTQVTKISYSASVFPLKLCLAEIPLTWEVQFPLESFLLPPPQHSSAACRSCSTPQPALLAQTHTWLTPVVTQTHWDLFLQGGKDHAPVNPMATRSPHPSPTGLDVLQQAAAPQPSADPGRVQRAQADWGVWTADTSPSQEHSCLKELHIPNSK